MKKDVGEMNRNEIIGGWLAGIVASLGCGWFFAGLVGLIALLPFFWFPPIAVVIGVIGGFIVCPAAIGMWVVLKPFRLSQVF